MDRDDKRLGPLPKAQPLLRQFGDGTAWMAGTSPAMTAAFGFLHTLARGHPVAAAKRALARLWIPAFAGIVRKPPAPQANRGQLEVYEKFVLTTDVIDNILTKQAALNAGPPGGRRR